MATKASDWTTRVHVRGLKPGREYWYRFTRADGAGSRIGRTLTAPEADDPRPVAFAFVSCQNINYGAQHAFRKMIHEDRAAPPEKRLGFVLHLGDFIYEMVWYPEDRPKGMYDRKIVDILRFAKGEKFGDYHIPVDVDDYRAVYRAYLADPDIQDARARWPGINAATKYVVSQTRTESFWENTVFINGDVGERVRRLKRQEGPDLQVHGSTRLVQALFKHDLVDELWLKIFPVTLGSGKRLFGEGATPASFKLVHSEVTPSGVIFADYERSGGLTTGSFG